MVYSVFFSNNLGILSYEMFSTKMLVSIFKQLLAVPSLCILYFYFNYKFPSICLLKRNSIQCMRKAIYYSLDIANRRKDHISSRKTDISLLYERYFVKFLCESTNIVAGPTHFLSSYRQRPGVFLTLQVLWIFDLFELVVS